MPGAWKGEGHSEEHRLPAFLKSCFTVLTARGARKAAGLGIMAPALEGLRALFRRKTEVYDHKEFQEGLC